jgi:Transposase DNA-binding
MGYALPTNRGEGRRGVKIEGIKIKERKKMAANLPDARLYARLERLVEQLSAAPMSGIPQACGSVHESKAAYRFLG